MPQKRARTTGREGWKNWGWKILLQKDGGGGKLYHKPLREGKNYDNWRRKEGKDCANWKSKQALPVCNRLENEE